MTTHDLETRARIFRMYDLQGMTFSQIADEEGMTRSAVGSVVRLWRGKIAEAVSVVEAMGWSVRR